jgi:DNA-binding SARP family transcriptional activator/tetratricopeptide (TPR) repeat protein
MPQVNPGSAAERTIRFEVLGPLRVSDGAPAKRSRTVVPPPRSPILRGLLGTLLVSGPQPLTAERLVELVWGDRAERVGPGAVQVAVSRLRRWLGRFGPPSESTWMIGNDGGGYRLALPGHAVDLTRFRAAAARAAQTRDPAGRLPALESALALWRGPVLIDLATVDLADPLFRAVDSEIQAAALALADAALAARRPGAAIDRLAALADAYSMHEGLEGRLLELLTGDGRAADALVRYRVFRDRVVEELGVEPGDRVHRAYLSALSSDHERPRRAADVAEVPGPEHGPVVPVPAQLPPEVADFVGRAGQVETLSEALTGRRTPAVTVITGMGGVGKTSLALHVAHRMAAEFPDGALYADLGAADGRGAETGRALEGFLLSLGVADRAIPSSIEHRSALYRSLLAGRRVLVVLDDAPSERDVRPLLPGSGGSAAIVTSRVPLTGLEGARTVDLEVFTSGQALELLDRIVGTGRLAAEPDAAAEIVRLCARTPLAVRIAGAKLAGRRHWTLARMAAALRDTRRRLDELSAGDLAVRACFELGYVRLPGATRRLFRHLALLEAQDVADWVAAPLLEVSFEAGRDHLEALVDAQLLTVSGTDPTGRVRYRFHDLVRIYARELAARDDTATQRAAVRRALATWLALAETAAERVPGMCYALIHGTERRLAPPAEVTAGLLADPTAWFDAERDALVAGVRQACALGLDELAWDLAASQEKYLDLKGMTPAWRRMHERALELCRSTGNLLGQAVLTRGLIEVTTWAVPDESGEAMVELYQRSVELRLLFERAGEPRGVSDALSMQAWGLVAMGEPERALATAREARQIAREHGHLGGEARAHHVSGLAHGEQNAEAAVTELTRFADLAVALGNPRAEATAMQFLGAAQCASGRITEGHDLLVRSLEYCRALQDRYAEAFSLLYLGKLYAATGDPRARPTVESVVSISRRSHMNHHLADALKVLGELELAAGEPEAAAARLEDAVRLWRKRGWHSFLAETLRSLGRAHRACGDEDAARRAWCEALALYRRLDDGDAVAQLSELLGEERATGIRD